MILNYWDPSNYPFDSFSERIISVLGSNSTVVKLIIKFGVKLLKGGVLTSTDLVALWVGDFCKTSFFTQ